MEPASPPLEVVVAGPEHTPGLVALFEAAGSPCYCRYWHFVGDSNAWLDRCANDAGRNRAELEGALADGAPEARGVVALAPPPESGEGADLVGWMKLAPAERVPKLYDRRLYRGLPCFSGDRRGVHTIGCALVHPLFRRRGVASALVLGAVRAARALGGTAIEAFPRRPGHPVPDEELWTGPVNAFARAGFVEVHAFEPYPVLRLEL